MTIGYAAGQKIALIYWDDLSPTTQNQLFEELDQSNGNYDVLPLAEITLAETDDQCCQKEGK